MTDTVTVRRELALDADLNPSWGDLIDDVLNALGTQLLAVKLDMTTPSSASSPALEITVPNTPENLRAIADLFFDEPDELQFV